MGEHLQTKVIGSSPISPVLKAQLVTLPWKAVWFDPPVEQGTDLQMFQSSICTSE